MIRRLSLRSLSSRFAVVVAVSLILGSSSLSFAATWSVHAEPARLVTGAPVLFQVKAPARLQSLQAKWLGHDLSFTYDSTRKTWFALAGVSLETSPGAYSLELTGETGAPDLVSNQLVFSKNFSIVRGKYPKTEVKLSVESKFTEPSPEQQKQIQESQEVKKNYLNRLTPNREWEGNFTTPADAAISDVFGSQRIFNGKTSSPHLGLDFRVPTGTAVEAMNDGTVVLARLLYFEGNFVVIDHGQGLLTLYLHLSEFKVKEGDTVKRGQVIGLSGGTGRATGPHLHVAVRWQGTYLDPASLIRMRLP